MNRYQLQSASALICFLFTACTSGSETEAGHAFRVYKENGVTISESSGGPKYEGEIFEFVKVVELVEDGRPESLMVRPSDFLMDSEGRFHVADTGDRRIVVFDQEGRYLRDYGRHGEGPGEFQTVRIQSIRDDIVSIYDSQLRRETRYRTDGVLLDITSIPLDHQHRPMEFFTLEEGVMAQVTQQREDIENDGFVWIDVLVHNALGDTVAFFATDRLLSGYRYSSVSNDRQIMRRINYPFAGTPIAAFSPAHGFASSDGKKPVINIFSTEGLLTRSIRIDLSAKPVTNSDKAAVVAYYENQLVDAEGPREDTIREMVKHLQYQEFKSPWYGFIIDDFGYFWIIDVELINLEKITEIGIDVLIVSPAGEFLGRSRMPPAMFLKFSGNRLLTNNQNQETGEYTLTVYEIRSKVGELKYP